MDNPHSDTGTARPGKLPVEPRPPASLPEAGVEIEATTVKRLVEGVASLTLGSIILLIGLLGGLVSSAFLAGGWKRESELVDGHNRTYWELIKQHGQAQMELAGKTNAVIAELEDVRNSLQAKISVCENERDQARRQFDAIESAVRTHESKDASKAQAFERLQRSLPAVAGLAKEFLEDAPDGLADEEAIAKSLMRQVLNTNGFAEFLSGSNASSVQVEVDEGFTVHLDWSKGKSAAYKTLERLGRHNDEALVHRVNSDLNQVGVAFLDDSTYIVRGPDGGVALVSPDTSP